MQRRSFSRRAAALPVLVLAAAALSACAEEPFPTMIYAERPCYRTLADVDCHLVPLAGEQARRVDFYDAPIAVVQ